GVFIGVNTSLHFGGSGHINPAITFALILFKGFDPVMGLEYILVQFAGAIVGAVLVWMAYKKQFDATESKEMILAVFSNSPSIRSTLANIITEVIGTFVLLFGALCFSAPSDALGTLNALPAALLVLGIGLSLGGPTGYAINPARDLGPRLAHFFLPIPNKGDSDWDYSWIPVMGPVIGACLAVLLFNLI
ncbi:MAG TPA: MIP/aquaporin family protein, partial [Saprospiraceae bacterium]|nr:MIP/aquaporin family protein [Saprospiraceae bacterium]